MAEPPSIWDILSPDPAPTPPRAPRKRRSESANPPRARARTEPESIWDILGNDDAEPSDDEPPPATLVNRAVVNPALTQLHAHVNDLRRLTHDNRIDSTTPTTVPFQLPREADRVPDVGTVLAEMPSALIEELAANRSRAFLTEPLESTARRTPLQLFEQHTRCLRGTRGTQWITRLAPWAGMIVATREPANIDSAPLCRAWPAVDVARRVYSLAVFELMPSFYVAVVLRTDGDSAESVYVGAFYMQSEQSHAADS